VVSPRFHGKNARIFNIHWVCRFQYTKSRSWEEHCSLSGSGCSCKPTNGHSSDHDKRCNVSCLFTMAKRIHSWPGCSLLCCPRPRSLVISAADLRAAVSIGSCGSGISLSFKVLLTACLTCDAPAQRTRSQAQPLHDSTVQVIYTGIPLWSAALAYILLGEQPFHTIGWLGAICIICAGLIIASARR
jgi:hypothetical protein